MFKLDVPFTNGDYSVKYYVDKYWSKPFLNLYENNIISDSSMLINSSLTLSFWKSKERNIIS